MPAKGDFLNCMLLVSASALQISKQRKHGFLFALFIFG